MYQIAYKYTGIKICYKNDEIDSSPFIVETSSAHRENGVSSQTIMETRALERPAAPAKHRQGRFSHHCRAWATWHLLKTRRWDMDLWLSTTADYATFYKDNYRSYGNEHYNSDRRTTTWCLHLMWSRWWTKGLDGVGGALVIRSTGLRIQILATAANRTGHLVTEGKISLAVCPRWS